MAKVILNVIEFSKVLSKGDKFWYMSSCGIEPLAIVGPCIVDEISNFESSILVFYLKGKKPCADMVETLTGRWNGVFLSEGDAVKYLASRKKAFATDPVLLAERKKRERQFKRSLNEIPPLNGW